MTTGFIAGTINSMIDTIRTGGATKTAITTAYVQLHTGDPGAAGTSSVSVATTTRVAVSHGTVANGGMTMNGTAPSWTNGTGGTPTTETISHISVWSAATGGTCLYTIPLSASKNWSANDQLTLNSCGVSVSPVAA